MDPPIPKCTTVNAPGAPICSCDHPYAFDKTTYKCVGRVKAVIHFSRVDSGVKTSMVCRCITYLSIYSTANCVPIKSFLFTIAFTKTKIKFKFTEEKENRDAALFEI